jgi:hypothetical protein
VVIEVLQVNILPYNLLALAGLRMVLLHKAGQAVVPVGWPDPWPQDFLWALRNLYVLFLPVALCWNPRRSRYGPCQLTLGNCCIDINIVQWIHSRAYNWNNGCHSTFSQFTHHSLLWTDWICHYHHEELEAWAPYLIRGTNLLEQGSQQDWHEEGSGPLDDEAATEH